MRIDSLKSDIIELPFRFQVGDRRLFAAKRRLIRHVYDLDAILSDVPPTLSLGSGDTLIQSMPRQRLREIRARRPGMLVYVRQYYPRHYAVLDGTFSAYLDRMSSQRRSMLKRKVRKFTETCGGALDVREYRTPAEMADFHRLARQVSEKTYQERLLDAGLPDHASFRASMTQRAREDKVRGYLLFAEGQPVSYLYTPIEEGCVLYAYLGYDPGFAAYSPGTVLQYEAMARLFGEGRYRLFDFSNGDGQHKRQFSTDQVDCVDVVLLRPTLANRLLVASHAGFNHMIERIGQLTKRWGIKARLRRLLRAA